MVYSAVKAGDRQAAVSFGLICRSADAEKQGLFSSLPDRFMDRQGCIFLGAAW